MSHLDFASMSLEELQLLHMEVHINQRIEYANQEITRKINLGHVVNDFGGGCDIDAMIEIFKRDTRLLQNIEPKVKSIISINAGTGKCEDYFSSKVFPNATIIHTDINPPCKEKNVHNVQKKSALEAVRIPCDMIFCFMPYFKSDGYLDLVSNLNCKFLLFLGHFSEGDHCDPGFEYYSITAKRSLIQQLKCEMKLMWIETVNRNRYYPFEHLAIFEKVPLPENLNLKSHNLSICSHLDMYLPRSEASFGIAKILETVINEKKEEKKKKEMERAQSSSNNNSNSSSSRKSKRMSNSSSSRKSKRLMCVCVCGRCQKKKATF